MNLNHLSYFSVIAHTGSYSRASEELSVSSPSLTYAIKALEQELGAPLLASSNKGTVLTEYGRYFLPFADGALAQIEKGRRGLAAMIEGKQVIEIAAVGPMCNVQAPWYIKKFEESDLGRNVHINIHFASSGDAIEMLRSGFCDVAFAGLEFEEKLAGLDFHPLAYDKLYLVVPFDHPLASKKRVTMHDLLDYDFIGFSDHTGVKHVIAERFQRECGRQPHVISESELTFEVVGMVGAHMGIAICPDKQVFRHARVKARQIDNKPWKRTMGIVYRKEEFPRKVVSDFVDFVSGWVSGPIPVLDYPDQYLREE